MGKRRSWNRRARNPCPLPAGVIARVIWELVDREQPGLYHLGGSERLSRWEIGEALLSWYPELKGRLVKGFAKNHVGSFRPADLSLRCDKIQNLNGSSDVRTEVKICGIISMEAHKTQGARLAGMARQAQAK